MSSWKRMGMVLAVVAAVGFPQTASALSISSLSDLRNLLLGWSQQIRDYRDNNQQHHYNRPHYQYPHGPRTHPDRAVPEPTAALLFGLGAVVVAQRSRKPR